MSQARSVLLSIERGLHVALTWVLFAILGVMVAAVFAGVVFRYVLSDPLSWSEELSRYLMVWAACLGASVAAREGSHMAVTMLVARIGGAAGRAVSAITQTVVLVFMGFLTWYGLLMAMKQWSQQSPAMELPMMFPYMAVPAGGLLIMFELVMNLVAPIPRAEPCE